MSSESRKREVLQLLRDWRAFHSPFGGAMPVDETGVVDAAFGPAGYIEEGREFDRKVVPYLRESFYLLRLGLKVLRGMDFEAWGSLDAPYFSDPADPSLVADWRMKAKRPGASERTRKLIADHDRAIETLTELLEDADLFVVWPKRMSSQEESQIERRNDELYRVYRVLREEGKRKSRAVESAAAVCGYGERRAWEIVRMRESERRAG